MLTASSESRRRAFRPATLALLVLAGCAQPVDAPARPRANEAAPVADLQLVAERIAAELPGRSKGTSYPAPPSPHEVRALERQIGPAEWKLLEEAARRELPALVVEAEALASQRSR